ncbi:MAG: hypothetical protein ACLQVD_16890 [Capsulimonadaceae bacterium]
MSESEHSIDIMDPSPLLGRPSLDTVLLSSEARFRWWIAVTALGFAAAAAYLSSTGLGTDGVYYWVKPLLAAAGYCAANAAIPGLWPATRRRIQAVWMRSITPPLPRWPFMVATAGFAALTWGCYQASMTPILGFCGIPALNSAYAGLALVCMSVVLIVWPQILSAVCQAALAGAKRARAVRDNSRVLPAAAAWLRAEVHRPVPAILTSRWFPLAACLAGSFALHWRTVRIGFLSDDWCELFAVDQNQLLLPGWEFFRPAAYANFWVDAKLFGHRTMPWHIENLIVYGLTAYLVYCLTWRIARQLPNARVAAWVSAGVFLALPSHTEPICWLCDRFDLHGAFETVAGMLAYLKYRDTARYRYFGLTVLLLATALFTKEAMVTMPVAVIAAELLRRRWLNAVVMGGCEVSYLFIRAHVVGKLVGGYYNRVLPKNWHMAALSICGHFGRELPSPLVLFVVAALLYAAWSNRNRGFLKTILGVSLVYALAYVPVMTTVVVRGPVRFTYLPSVFSCLLAGIALAYAASDRRRQSAVAVAMGVFVTLISFLPQAIAADRDWIAAGRLTRAAISRAALAHSRYILPQDRIDSIGMAYVFRNGWNTAAVQREDY